ncbi:peptide deformylase [Spiroplasma culicicola]|uniref:Peptide deformylase n=1 Tax=Spiroplasma culicicola AES-1 TaxID=1276246 RepID=W6A8C6_9MOLU|nr:peptide deformylase [Spiroplasma culicicola]AHI53201.1 peptide deformylase [Spiroplasma culicicola AES-1]
MKLDITKDLLQTEIPTNKWLWKDSQPEVIRNQSVDVALPLNEEHTLVMQKLIDFVRYSQDGELNQKTNSDYLRPAVGLAAPQIGSNTNMFFVRFEWDEENGDVEEFAMINPKIIAQSEQITYLNGGEGCLSVDVDQHGIVPRSYKIQVTGYEWLTEQEVTLTLRGYQAIVFQHEIEHNHGKLYYDRINQKDPQLTEENWIMI